MNVGQWTDFHATFRPDGVAIRFHEDALTWKELDDRVARAAGGLIAEGVEPGDRVGILLRNHPAFIETVLAVARIGAAFVPLNVMLTPPELSFIVEHSGVGLLVTDESFVDRLEKMTVLPEDDRIFYVGEVPGGARGYDELLDHDPAPWRHEVQPDDALAICYTSGTTGLPKGAVLTHRSVEAMGSSTIAVNGLNPEDRGLLSLPLAFTGSIIAVVMPLLKAGANLRLMPKFDAVECLDYIEADRISFIIGVPTMFDRMLRSEGFDDRDLSSLRVVRIGGANIPPSLVQEFVQRGIEMVGAYGLTESGAFNLQLPPDQALSKLGSSGKPLLGQQTKVVRADGSPASVDEVGEILIRGDVVMKEYLNDPEATKRTLVDGWLHSGDLARVDEDGFFWIVDRAKDMLISGGLNVYPSEIEHVLRRFDGVVDVAVVGVPDEKWGEVPKAFIVASGKGLDEEALLAFARLSLAEYKVPKHFEFLDDLPKTMSGKVLKRELRGKVVS